MKTRVWLLVPSLSLFAGLSLLAPGSVQADEILLKGGAKFTGRIEQQTETMVTINLGDGVVGVPMVRVEKIVKGRSPLDEYDERARALAPGDLNGWRGLGAWAAHEGLSAQSREAYAAVMAAAPDDPEARHALGFVQVNGRWMTEEESYAARGYVKYDGEWMTPAEAQASQAGAAAEQARQDAERRANQAEADKILAESRAAKAEEKAREAAEVDPWTQPALYWGGYGYGITTWPSAGNINNYPAYRSQGVPGLPKQ